MAKAMAKCKCTTCGAEFTQTKICPTRSDADSWEEWAVDHLDTCSDCYKAGKEREKQVAAERAAEKSSEMCLPELTGTPKQIAWATTIRFSIIAEFEEKFTAAVARFPDQTDQINMIKQILSAMKQKTDSKFWIDNRSYYDAFETIQKEIANGVTPDAQTPSETEQTAEDIGTVVKPVDTKHDGIATIDETEEVIFVAYPAKNETLIAIAKSLGYKWSDRRWRIQKSYKTENPIDRIAELGNALLNAGFCIDIKNPEAREKAINADFIPFTKKWISSPIDEPERVSISWGERDEKIYQAARKIPTAKYSNGAVLVGVSAYKEIEDFAEIYGFKFSPGARKKISCYEDKINNAYTVVPAEPKPQNQPDKLVEILKSSSDIPDDLKD